MTIDRPSILSDISNHKSDGSPVCASIGVSFFCAVMSKLVNTADSAVGMAGFVGVTMLLQTDPSLYSISTTGLFIVVTPSIYVFCPNSIVATLIVDSVRSFDHTPLTVPSLECDPPMSEKMCVPRSTPSVMPVIEPRGLKVAVSPTNKNAPCSSVVV